MDKFQKEWSSNKKTKIQEDPKILKKSQKKF